VLNRHKAPEKRRDNKTREGGQKDKTLRILFQALRKSIERRGQITKKNRSRTYKKGHTHRNNHWPQLRKKGGKRGKRVESPRQRKKGKSQNRHLPYPGKKKHPPAMRTGEERTAKRQTCVTKNIPSRGGNRPKPKA